MGAIGRPLGLHCRCHGGRPTISVRRIGGATAESCVELTIVNRASTVCVEHIKEGINACLVSYYPKRSHGMVKLLLVNLAGHVCVKLR